MTNLERRLRQLEAVMTDSSGLVPGTPEWRDYWRRWLIRRNEDPDFQPRHGMPIEALRAIMRNWLGDEEESEEAETEDR
jgi:hypothetical protein